MKAKQTVSSVPPYRFIASVTGLSVVCIALLMIRIAATNSSRYGFLFWNLFLAAVPVLLAWWLAARVRKHGWLKWQQIVLTVTWIGFLPNSFYIITDLIHLRANYEADLLFDITLLTGFIVSGLFLGYLSVYLVHLEVLKRLRERWVYAILAVLFLAVSFAICLGRYTRWNTWDILLQPAGLLFDVSDRLLNPAGHMQTYQTTLVLFILLFSSYTVVYEAARFLKPLK